MTFTCFPLKNTETDGKDSVFTNYLGEVSKKQCDEIINVLIGLTQQVQNLVQKSTVLDI